MNRTVIHEMPQPLGLFAGELFLRGKEYLDAFDALTDGVTLKHYYAGSYLFSHSLELLLKSFLAANEVSKKSIRNCFGHNLEKILKGCQERNLPKIINLGQFVKHYDEMNRDHDFRYPTGYNLTVPRPADSIRVARALESAIFGFVASKRMSAELQFSSDTRHLRGVKVRWSD